MLRLGEVTYIVVLEVLLKDRVKQMVAKGQCSIFNDFCCYFILLMNNFLSFVCQHSLTSY